MAFQMLSRSKSVTKRSSKYLDEALYRSLFKEGGSETSVRKRLNEFLRSRKRVFKWELDDTLKKLRDRRLYAPALKLSETMTFRGTNKTVSDQAIHLDLVAKAKGIPAAEDYFVALPETSKNHLCYGALLNCYCKESMTTEAEALMEKMKELNLQLTSMSYNSLMTLYEKKGQPEKVRDIIQEMKAANVMLDSYSYNVWMRALSAMNDVSGVERVVDEMKRDGRVIADWAAYSNLASIFVEVGSFAKAEAALKELEKKNAHKDHSAFQFLITLYGKTGNLVEVYRVWRSLRLAFRNTSNISYLNMIQVLVNLKDLPGAEKCFREWQSSCSTYDIRIANVLIRAYAKEGSIDKALELKRSSCLRGAKPNSKTHEIFLDYYIEKEDYKSAGDCVVQAILTGKGNGEKWIPRHETVKALMQNFEKRKDVEGAEGLLENLKKVTDDVSADMFELLIRTYAGAGRANPSLQRRLKMEGVEVSEGSKKLLETICAD